MTLGDIAALLTAAGAIAYVLGLVGFTIPIWRVYHTDFSTAWYAVSLVPNTVVAGQGVRIWVRWPAAITAVLLLARSVPVFSSERGLAILVAFVGLIITIWLTTKERAVLLTVVLSKRGASVLANILRAIALYGCFFATTYAGGTLIGWGLERLDARKIRGR
jgi:hypothetical protein